MVDWLPGIPRIHGDTGDTYDNGINTQHYCQSPVETDCLCLRLDPPPYNVKHITQPPTYPTYLPILQPTYKKYQQNIEFNPQFSVRIVIILLKQVDG